MFCAAQYPAVRYVCRSASTRHVYNYYVPRGFGRIIHVARYTASSYTKGPQQDPGKTSGDLFSMTLTAYRECPSTGGDVVKGERACAPHPLPAPVKLLTPAQRRCFIPSLPHEKSSPSSQMYPHQHPEHPWNPGQHRRQPAPPPSPITRPAAAAEGLPRRLRTEQSPARSTRGKAGRRRPGLER